MPEGPPEPDTAPTAVPLRSPWDDPRTVAAFRLPVSLAAMGPLVKTIEAAYGPGAAMRQEGRWLVIATPEGRPPRH